MAKRFTDTLKWRKIWFRTLTPIEKCFWLYLCDTCDHAGVWEVDFELAEIFIGAKLDIEQIKIVFKKQFVELKDGKKWQLEDFVGFQKPLEEVKDKEKDKKETQVFTLPAWIDETAWNGFIEMRKRNKHIMTIHALNLAVAELGRLKEQGEDPTAVLNQSTFRGYKGLFKVDSGEGKKTPKPTRFTGLNEKNYSEGVDKDGKF